MLDLLPGAVGNPVYLDLTLPRDLTHRHQRREPVHGGAHHVVRVVGTETLGENVGDPAAFQDGPHRAARDDPGTGRGRLEQHRAGSVPPQNLVRDGGPGAGDFHHAPLGGFDRLAHRFGDFVGLAGGQADPALAVAHRHQGVEGEPPAALHHLGDPVDVHHLLDKLRLGLVASPVPPGAALAAPSPPVAAPSPALTAPAATTSTATAAAAAAALGGRRGGRGGRGGRGDVSGVGSGALDRKSVV